MTGGAHARSLRRGAQATMHPALEPLQRAERGSMPVLGLAHRIATFWLRTVGTFPAALARHPGRPAELRDRAASAGPIAGLARSKL